MIKSWQWIWVLALCFLAVWAGCNRQRPPAKFKLAFVTNNKSDFWEIARKGCLAAQGELGDAELLFYIPDKGTVEQQNQVLREAVAAGARGVAVSPVDQAAQVTVLNEIARAALLITQDSDAPGSNRACYVGSDNTAAGRQAGDLIKKALPKGGKVMVFVGQIDAPNANRRYVGLQESLAKSNIRLLGVKTDDTDRGLALRNVQETLTEHPDVAGMIGLWSYNGPVILAGLQAAGKAGKVQVVCFDEEEKTLMGVRQGEIFATIVQQPYQFGYLSIQVMHDILDGKPAPKEPVIVPTLVVDKNNVDVFFEKMTRLRQGS